MQTHKSGHSLISPENWPPVLNALLRRAATDTAFRKTCLADARAAFKEIAGAELPSGVRIRFVEPTGETVITLPKLRAAGEEVSDADLERIAGGASGTLLPVRLF